MAPKKSLIQYYDNGTLDLSLHSIQEIPVKDIAAIPKATDLDLSCNNIISLPKSFATSLTRLVKLDLSQNQLDSLPDNFGLLVNLKHLDLDSNKLVSLPLSFGNLKHLRWLDLKRNPLMPKLAEIAGQCLDTQQCQSAARNVVAALHSMQDQVNAEITRRKEEQTRKLELEEESVKIQTKENHQSKKKKKKVSNAIKTGSSEVHANGQTHSTNEIEDENTAKENSPELSSVPVEKFSQKPSLFRKVGRLLSATVTFLVMSFLLILFCGFLLSLLDEQLYSSVHRRVVQVIQSKVPKHYLKRWDRWMLVTHRVLMNGAQKLLSASVLWYTRIQDFIVTVNNHEVVQHYLDSLKSCWQILWIWFSELPYFFNSLQSSNNS